jgi:SAM-dependent methyltransferase
VQNVEIIEGVAEQMPFENNFFDLIVSNNGLNNVQDLTAVLKECNRVARAGAQFVFTFNTDQTFIEFYNVFREVLRKNGVKEYETKIDEHIYDKRKPLSEYKNLLKESGFRINAVYEDEFCYKFSDGTSMLNHFSTKFFVNVWKELVPEDMQSKIFQEIENKIDLLSETSQGLSMGVPFITIDCEKVKG